MYELLNLYNELMHNSNSTKLAYLIKEVNYTGLNRAKIVY